MEELELDEVQEKIAERVLEEFLKPYTDQGIVDGFVMARNDNSLMRKSRVSYHILNGDYSGRLDNNIDYSCDGDVYESYKEVIEYAYQVGKIR